MTLKYKQQNIIHTVHDLTFQTFSFHVLIFSLIKREAEGRKADFKVQTVL